MLAYHFAKAEDWSKALEYLRKAAADFRRFSYGSDAANVLFQVVNDQYLNRRPMIFTTNKPLAAWGRVLHDPDLAEAILDRILERGRQLDVRGASYRTKHLKLDVSRFPDIRIKDLTVLY